METQVAIHFFIKKTNINSKGKVPIYMRITINGKRIELSANRFISPDDWKKEAGAAKSRKDENSALNMHLNTLRTKVYKALNNLELCGTVITPEVVKLILKGNTQRTHMLIETIQYHNARMESLIGKDYAIGTLKRYEVTLRKVQAYLLHQYRKNDIPLSELNHGFITGFELYLKSHDNLENNTSMKYIKNLKKIIHVAIMNDWIDKDPFIRFKCSYIDPNREPLTEDELNKLKSKNLPMQRLEVVRDMFLFSCYTGLAYSDIEKLTMEDIILGIDGEKWITIYRKKTNTRSSIPLLPPALEIIQKYQCHSESVRSNSLLPVITNQKTNAYLKEIAVICEIDKHLTFHIARHTFATTITLTNGVPIETVSKMLGHVSIRTTQTYCKVIDTKVSNDMRQLRDKLYYNNGCDTAASS